MKRVASTVLAIVGLLHVWFFVLETFLWKTKLAAQMLSMRPDEAEATAILAGNQGVYNAVVAAGLFWSLRAKNPVFALQLRTFFLTSVIAVGIYGAVSARILVLFVQALPGALALGLSILAARAQEGHERG